MQPATSLAPRFARRKHTRRRATGHAGAAALLLVALVMTEEVMRRFGLPALCRDVAVVYFGISTHILVERIIARWKPEEHRHTVQIAPEPTTASDGPA